MNDSSHAPINRRDAEIAKAAAEILTFDTAADRIGFMGRCYIATCLPHRDPGGAVYERHNGPYSLTLTSSRGIPYGKVPRLLLGYIQTAVVRRQVREICLGKTLTDAARTIGLLDAGKQLADVAKQVKRATATSYEATFHGGGQHRTRWFRIATAEEYRYDPDRPAQVEMWQPTITVSDDLFRELVDDKGGVPFDWRVVRALRSPLAIDFYLYTTHTSHRFRNKPTNATVTIQELHRAFGSGYPDTPRGRKNFQQALSQSARQIKALWPDLPVRFERGGVEIIRGKPHISPTRQSLPPTE